MSKWFNILGLSKLERTLQRYLKVRISILKYEISLHIYKLIFFLVGVFCFLILLFSSFLVATLALIYYINELLNGHYVGYLLVAGLYLVLSLVLLKVLVSPSFVRRASRFAARLAHKHDPSKEA